MMTPKDKQFPIYDMSINLRATWQAHSMSNAGNNGSIRLLPRRQMLADANETDACSGNILKHYHAVLLAEIYRATGVGLCPACAVLDGRRAGALIELPEYKGLTIERILRECGLCDTHGFLITAKNGASDGSSEARQRMSKHSLVEFSYALALPYPYGETIQLTTRMGSSKEGGQMLMKTTSRSGTYALCVRYSGIGVGVDTEMWSVRVPDEHERAKRHRAVLAALRDQLLSPLGALTASMLPHLSGLCGAIVVRDAVGRAPLYSPLDDNFITELTSMASETCHVFSFETPSQFKSHMDKLIHASVPASLPSEASMVQI